MAKLNISVLSASIMLLAGLRMMEPYPNIEPITLFTITTALVYGPLQAALLGAGALAASDFMMGFPGPWTLYCAFAFGAIGVVCGFAGFLKRKWSREELTGLAFAMTILYDATTATFWGLSTGSVFAAYAAQVPFTLLHLSNCVLAYALAPTLIAAFERVKDFSPIALMRGLRLNA
jgi:uncharacterized membrane protein